MTPVRVALTGILAWSALSCAAVAHSEAAKLRSNHPPIPPPSVVLSRLYPDVALSGIFADSKTWADALPKRPPSEILAEWERIRTLPDYDIHSFIRANFDLPSDQNVNKEPTRGLSLQGHIAELWPLLTRDTRAVPAWSSLLPLLHPYVVPGGRFREIYYWDSYFTLLGMGPEHTDLRSGMVDNFAFLIRTYGLVPNGSRSYYLSRSQPPFFFKMVELARLGEASKAFAKYLPELKAEYAFWMKGSETARVGKPVARVVRMADGALLNRYWDDRSTPRDEAYAADVSTAAASREPATVYRHLRAGAESGWDFSSRWLADAKTLPSIRTTNIIPPDLNGLLYGLERAIAQGCAEVADKTCVTAFRGKATARASAMRRYLWNPGTGLYDDYGWREGKTLGHLSAASLYPLYVGLASKAEALSTAVTIERELLKSGGLVTTNVTTGQQWDAPNGWAPLQWIAVQGLRAYGEDELARKIATRWLATVACTYAETGKLLEKYDVVEARPGGGGEYPLQDGFGWTNGTTIALLRLYPQAIDKLACRTGISTPPAVPTH